VKAENLDRKKVHFQNPTSADLLDFPEFSMNDLELLLCGTYQISQAISYFGEMLQADGTLLLQYLLAEPGIIRFDV